MVKDADKKGILAIVRETGELASKTRQGKFGLDEMPNPAAVADQRVIDGAL